MSRYQRFCLQIMRTMGDDMAWLLKEIQADSRAKLA